MKRCEHVTEAWGPNEGCREFMVEPDRFVCTEQATHTLSVADQFGGTELVVCGRHAAEAVDDDAGDASVVVALIVHAVSTRAGIKGQESNFVVECSCGYKSNVATARVGMVLDTAREHLAEQWPGTPEFERAAFFAGVKVPERERQPRERPVPCQRCVTRSTFNLDAVCDTCAAKSSTR